MSQSDLQDLTRDHASLSRATTLFREPGLRALLLHLKAGERIPAHQTSGSIMIHCLEGEGAFFVGDDRTDLRPGLVISLPPAASHSVTAGESKHLLLLVAISEQIPSER